MTHEMKAADQGDRHRAPSPAWDQKRFWSATMPGPSGVTAQYPAMDAATRTASPSSRAPGHPRDSWKRGRAPLPVSPGGRSRVPETRSSTGTPKKIHSRMATSTMRSRRWAPGALVQGAGWRLRRPGSPVTRTTGEGTSARVGATGRSTCHPTICPCSGEVPAAPATKVRPARAIPSPQAPPRTRHTAPIIRPVPSCRFPNAKRNVQIRPPDLHQTHRRRGATPRPTTAQGPTLRSGAGFTILPHRHEAPAAASRGRGLWLRIPSRIVVAGEGDGVPTDVGERRRRVAPGRREGISVCQPPAGPPAGYCRARR